MISAKKTSGSQQERALTDLMDELPQSSTGVASAAGRRNP